jgi:outer membrane protein TolC
MLLAQLRWRTHFFRRNKRYWVNELLTTNASHSAALMAEAEENLRQVENRVRVDIEEELRKVRRAETGLEAARESVAARAEMRRITANQVEANTVNPSALKEAEGQLAEAEAGLFQAEMERSTARAEMERTVGRT